MMLKETLREIVKSQRKDMEGLEIGVIREKLDDIDINLPFALVISGVRRCGKSTLLLQLIRKRKNFYYFNFEDPRAASFEAGDFQKLNDVFAEEYGKADCYFFDEIQNAQKWELFVRQMLDKKMHFVLTGSNASLLSKELGTRLTGRHIRFELFPFSFGEFLKITKSKSGINSFESYMKRGGFPQYLKDNRNEILYELLNDIIVRDIVVRYNLRNPRLVKEVAIYLLTNIGKEFSYRSLNETFGLGSVNTIISLISYFEDSYLLFTIPRFSHSLKKQIKNPKKVYAIDNGLSATNSASFSEDKGRMLENTVFLHLRRKYKNVFYFREKHECDFLAGEKNNITAAIQVCYELNDDNKEREIKGLQEALDVLNLKEGMILTFNQEDELSVANKKVIIMPVWKWLTS
ncbi:MAG: ATP-binding protein [Candidatus Aenigmarchaeota archaeon]|nr:ATP-binding protein [Candidatus Aenigmarchaeota archaeon]